MKFYSQHGEDRWLYDHGYIVPNGTYVDIGAAWPTNYSNTAILRDLGWSGIQIDGCDYFKKFWDKLGLELIVEVVWTGNEAGYVINKKHPNFSKIGSVGNPVATKRLNDLLASHGIDLVDLLSVDVEGAEYDIISTLDFNKHRPAIILWEYNTLGVKDERLKPMLEDRGYKCVHRTECNYIHIHGHLVR